jgi:hypothetical protein
VADPTVLVGSQTAHRIRLECRTEPGRGTATLLRLFVDGRPLAAVADPFGLGPFNGLVVGGVSMTAPLEARFVRAALEALPSSGSGPVGRVCQDLEVTASVEDDVAWFVDSGATVPGTERWNPAPIHRLASEIAGVALALGADQPALPAGSAGRAPVTDLVGDLVSQWQRRDVVASFGEAFRPDPGPAMRALGCPAVRPGSVLSGRLRTVGELGGPRGPEAIPGPVPAPTPTTTPTGRPFAPRRLQSGSAFEVSPAADDELFRDLPSPPPLP